ncbi:MAG: hypothetical protein PHW87_00610 [Methanothrix sp.]|nr:hypothetical protein [Methanothrix sp.]
MSSFILHVGITAICPHGGQISVITPNSRVLVGGQPVATIAGNFLIAGCAFTIPPGKPQPCVKVQWIMPATRVFVGGQPVILQSSTGLCQSAEQIPQGPPNILLTQLRARGT